MIFFANSHNKLRTAEDEKCQIKNVADVSSRLLEDIYLVQLG